MKGERVPTLYRITNEIKSRVVNSQCRCQYRDYCSSARCLSEGKKERAEQVVMWNASQGSTEPVLVKRR